MKKILAPCLCLAMLATSAVAAERAQLRMHRIADPAPAPSCEDNMERDSMETVPATDNPEPVLLKTAEAGCKAPERPVHA